MIPILRSRDGELAIAQLAADRGLLAFDFDGTLAPMVADRGAAAMRPATRGLLRAAAVWYPCAVVSGRARADVAARVSNAPLVAVVGEHGADAGGQPTPPAVLRTVERWASDLLADLGGHPGIAIEVKRWSLAIHYRAAPDPGHAAALVRAAAARLPAARVFGGAAVVNVVPAGAPDKGTAVATLARSVGARSVLYVGDDDTDEDAFRSPAVTVAVRVGRTPLSSARWVLEEQREMDLLLGALVRARSRRTLGDGRPASPLTPLQEDGP